MHRSVEVCLILGSKAARHGIWTDHWAGSISVRSIASHLKVFSCKERAPLAPPLLVSAIRHLIEKPIACVSCMSRQLIFTGQGLWPEDYVILCWGQRYFAVPLQGLGTRLIVVTSISLSVPSSLCYSILFFVRAANCIEQSTGTRREAGLHCSVLRHNCHAAVML